TAPRLGSPKRCGAKAAPSILAAMPVDVAAEVIANRPLSSDYNVLTLAAPTIGAAAAPGQFVMLKAAPGVDPLLRRPISVFEIVRDGRGAPAGSPSSASGSGPRHR